MKSLLTAGFAALLFATSPAWADGGHGHGKHGHKHAEKHWKKHHKHWAKHHRQYYDERVVHHYYRPAPRVTEYYHYAPAPRVTQHHYYEAPQPVYSPPPGVHVVLPNIYLPF